MGLCTCIHLVREPGKLHTLFVVASIAWDVISILLRVGGRNRMLVACSHQLTALILEEDYVSFRFDECASSERSPERDWGRLKHEISSSILTCNVQNPHC